MNGKKGLAVSLRYFADTNHDHSDLTVSKRETVEETGLLCIVDARNDSALSILKM